MKKKGIIIISRNFLKEPSVLMYSIFSRFIPLYIQDNPFNNTVQYWGISESFDECKEGEPTPEYEAIFQFTDGIEQFLKFERK
jgi:hypothetical protein